MPIRIRIFNGYPRQRLMLCGCVARVREWRCRLMAGRCAAGDAVTAGVQPAASCRVPARSRRGHGRASRSRRPGVRQSAAGRQAVGGRGRHAEAMSRPLPPSCRTHRLGPICRKCRNAERIPGSGDSFPLFGGKTIPAIRNSTQADSARIHRKSSSIRWRRQQRSATPRNRQDVRLARRQASFSHGRRGRSLSISSRRHCRSRWA